MRPSLAGVIARCASAAQNLRSQASARPRPAADGDAADDGDGRAIEAHQRLEAVLDRIAIVARRRGVAVDLAEFGNVGAGAEMRALALDERHQQVLARLDRGADRRQRPPHRAVNRIAAFRAVEDDPGERRLEAQGYVGHEALGAPEGTPRRSIALCRLRAMMMSARSRHRAGPRDRSGATGASRGRRNGID